MQFPLASQHLQADQQACPETINLLLPLLFLSFIVAFYPLKLQTAARAL